MDDGLARLPLRPAPSDGVTVNVCTDVDFRLIVGDMLAKLRRHERLRSSEDLTEDAVPMLFVTLPVSDLARARAFYEGLGFSVNEHSSDQERASVVLDDTIVLTLLIRDRFAERFPGGGPGNAPTALHALMVDRRAEVDDLLSRAGAVGGTQPSPAREDPSGYTGSFTDPDGHVWDVTYLEPVHVID